ncbi:MAG: phosphoserine phosphatase SerB, partial [Actinomycetota bacterium]
MMKYRLVLFDVDSTLIEQEVIDLLAKRTPSAQQVADITERAMRGEIDFDQALTKRVALLAGLSEQIFTDVLSEISFTAGALDLLHELRSRGVAIGVVSGGFHNVLDNLF